jgi:aryl-alcohol dehydrogenase-like predicted oxidoreductase
MSIPKRILGRTGEAVTILGLGGEGILRSYGNNREAAALINRALDLGVTYCESARAYAGSEAYYGHVLRERRQEIFLASKSHARDRAGALAHLHDTLRNLRTDYLDLWQVHDVRTPADVATIFGRDGAIEAFQSARQQGLTRFIGVTGHHDPTILKRCLELFRFDTVLMPVNPAEAAYRSFCHHVMPLAQAQGLGVIGMKVYLHGLAAHLPGADGMEKYFRYALSQPVSTIVIGCDDPGQLADNVRFAESFTPLADPEIVELEERLAPMARQVMYYKP